MGLLDKKERILDVVLTDKGRDLLSKNQLDFSYYAFSDEGVDYSGSLNIVSGSFSGSFDDVLFRNLAPEADARKGRSASEPRDLQTFLYTIPADSKVMPSLQTSHTGTVILNRHYRVEALEDAIDTVATDSSVIDVVATVTGGDALGGAAGQNAFWSQAAAGEDFEGLIDDIVGKLEEALDEDDAGSSGPATGHNLDIVGSPSNSGVTR